MEAGLELLNMVAAQPEKTSKENKMQLTILNEKLEKLQGEIKAEEAYLELNDLYLDIQRGEVKLTHRGYNELQDLLHTFCPQGDSMHDWWWSEFQKLPGWLNV